MRGRIKIRKDYYGAALLIALGTAVLILGTTYRTGTLNHMGAGFTPVVLGALLILVGLAIGVTASSAAKLAAASSLPVVGHAHNEGKPEWRGWLCILGGVFGFVVIGNYGGLVPATFASVFISAMGDRQNTWKGAAILGAIITVFGTIVFHYGLKMQLPLFQWG
jgi:hypothetical protein